LSEQAVVLDRVTKKYGDVVAVRELSLSIERGEMFGLIGPDGAGKTTTIRLMCGLLKVDDGTVRVLGRDPVKDHARVTQSVGYLSQRFSLYGDLSVDENIAFFAEIHGLRMNDDAIKARRTRLLELTQLAPFRDRLADQLSGGMKQKLALCCALVHRPDILFLDEPTTGVDAVSRREFWDLLGVLKRSGLTTIVSTPYMDEATRCDRVALIHHGKLLGIDTPSDIAAAFGRPLLAVRETARYKALLALRTYEHVHSVYPFGDVMHYTDAREDAPVARIVEDVRTFLFAHGFAGASVEPLAPTVEDSFIARTEGAP